MTDGGTLHEYDMTVTLDDSAGVFSYLVDNKFLRHEDIQRKMGIGMRISQGSTGNER